MLCLVGAGYQIDWTVGGRILGEKNDTFPWVSDSLSSGLPSLRSPWTCYVREFVTPTHVPTRPPTLPPTTHPPSHHPSTLPLTCSPFHPLFKKGREFPAFPNHDNEQPVPMADLFLLFPSLLRVTSSLIPLSGTESHFVKGPVTPRLNSKS